MIERLFVKHFGVEWDASLRDKCGAKDKNGDDSELYASDITESRTDGPLFSIDRVDVPAKQRLRNGVDDNVGAIETLDQA